MTREAKGRQHDIVPRQVRAAAGRSKARKGKYGKERKDVPNAPQGMEKKDVSMQGKEG